MSNSQNKTPSMLPHASSIASKSVLKSRNALIVGAGIAGPVLAYFLHRYGVRPLVVERAPEPRAGGQSIDIRDAGREVIRHMGVENDIRKRLTGEAGVNLVDSKGRSRAAFGADAFGGEGFVSDIEILRGELAKVLYEYTRNDVEYIYGDHPLSINDQGNHVQVTFASGNSRKFDLVIGADGLRSKTRRLVFDNKSPINYLNLYVAYFTIPRRQSDTNWSYWYNPPRGRTITLRPDNQGTMRATLSFRSTERGYENLSVDKQKELLSKIFADGGFETPRLLQGLMDANEYYFEAIGQVKMDRWSQGRVALVGDAGYCPAPVTGMGTTLALVGSYILAGEIGRYQDHVEAFKQYEILMRPIVTEAQKILPIALRLAAPDTLAAITLRNAIAGLMAKVVVTRPIRKLLERRKTVDTTALPDYECLLSQKDQ